nr:sugar kinase [uncultured Roseateles sp.]
MGVNKQAERVSRIQHVAMVGECMLELQGEALGTLTQRYGGDTFNTAVYLARCGAAQGLCCHYATAVGDDPLSAKLLQRWVGDGLSTDLVLQIPGRLPGQYLIEVDERGERSFSYWREHSAAKAYFDGETSPLEQGVARWDALYLSGISLAILPPAGRERLFSLMQALRERGALVVFDNNYRPRLWPDVAQARAVFERAFALASMALVTADDHQALFGYAGLDAAVAAAQALPTPELLIKRGAAATLVRGRAAAAWQEAPTEAVDTVVDTTAAGDSFAAGYLSRRLLGSSALASACFGNRLAARVIQHRGAVIPAEAMMDLMNEAAR